MSKLLSVKKLKKLLISVDNSNITIFAIFGIINYPMFYILWNFLYNTEYENFSLRIAAGVLCFLLLIRNYWPKFLKKYVKLLWYITICYSLPFFCTYLSLINHFSLNWVVNCILATFLLVMLLDWVEFFLVNSIGILGGILIYYIQFGKPEINGADLSSLLINVLWIIIVCLIFSYNKSHKNKERNKMIQVLLSINKFLDKKVMERTENLNKALVVKEEFLNNISHEIRTPVHGIAGISEGLVDSWNELDDSKRFKFAKQVANNSQRLYSLIKVILDLSLINKGKLTMNLEEMDLIQTILDIKQECEELYFKTEDVSIDFIQNNILRALINGDVIRITQVLRNLLINAIKFTKKGKITIIINHNKDKNIFMVSVEDNGVGIPEDEKEEIFKPFFQSSLTKNGAGGTGLGLSISREIINAHGGEIWAENIPNGAKFSFTLPCNTKFHF